MPVIVPAAELPRSELIDAGTVVLVIRQPSGSERGERRDGLEGRAWRVRLGDGAVLPALGRSIRKRGIDGCRQVGNAVVWIEGRRGGHGEYGAVARVKYDSRSGDAFQLALEFRLNANIKRQHKIEAVCRRNVVCRCVSQLLPGALARSESARVDAQEPFAGESGEIAIVEPLHAFSPLDLQLFEEMRSQPFCRSRNGVLSWAPPSRIANHMGSERTVWIAPFGANGHVEPRKCIRVLGEAREGLFVQIAPYGKR